MPYRLSPLGVEVQSTKHQRYDAIASYLSASVPITIFIRKFDIYLKSYIIRWDI